MSTDKPTSPNPHESSAQRPSGGAELSADKLALLVLRARKLQQQKQAEQATAAFTAIPRRAPGAPAPLSYAQQRMWLLDRMEPGSGAYNMAASYRLDGAVEAARLALALDRLAVRHEALRTRFEEQDGAPVQVVAEQPEVPFAVIDLGALGPAQAEATARALGERDSHRAFDLERGPLVRATLLTADAELAWLSLVFHHILSDGWSVGIFFRELAALYREPDAALPAVAVQMADFAAWERQSLAGPVLAEKVAFWRERLAGAPPALELPTDRPRPHVADHAGDLVEARLPGALLQAAHELARRESASLFMVLLGAFQLLLGRLAGQDDVVVGSPSAGRSRSELEGTIGLFLNTLVLRTELAEVPTFRALVTRVRETALGAMRHQDLPFEVLLEELQPARELSRTPLFQVLFNLVSVEPIRLELGAAQVSGVEPDHPESKFDLTLYVGESEGELKLQLVYARALFDRARMVELLGQYHHLLAQVLAEPDAPLASHSLVTPEAARVLPQPRQPLPAEWRGSLPAALARHAAARPERWAVVGDDGERWSYRELDARASQLAHELLARGVGRGEVVAIWAQRTACLPWAVLGTLRAGAAFLMLDPAYPVARLLDYLRLAAPRACLHLAGATEAPPEVAAWFAEQGIAPLELPRLAAAAGFLAERPTSDPGVELGADDRAVLTFTSGSTATPKAVVGRHGPLTHFYPWMGERFGLGESDVFGMLSALSHDPLQRDLFTPLWFGATLAVPSPEAMGTPGYLAQWVRRQGVSVLHLTPAMMELVIDAAEVDAAPGGLPSLRRAFVVGDQLKKADVETFYGLAPALSCINLYGSTETQRSVSFFEVPRPGTPAWVALGREVLPLGTGMAGVQLLVLNAAGQLAGLGELGEIHVRSHHLAWGYLGDEALSAARFLPNPFAATTPSEVAGDRIYRTGDLGRYRPDGTVEFAGRVDHQVKLRGFRIELGEVEAVLARVSKAEQCVAVVREDHPGQARLVAYLVAPGRQLDPVWLRAELAERLPDYMVPAALVQLPALPMTRTGKVDRRALPPPPELAPSEAHAAPATPLEELLAGLWCELLGVSRVGRHDDFFALGGQSLLVSRLAARLRTLARLELPMRTVFEHPTVAGLAAWLERAGRGTRQEETPPLVALGATEAPLSFAQQRLWLLEQIEPGSIAYNLSGTLALTGRLEARALGGALSTIVARHEVLRTTFAAREDGEPYQRVAPAARFPLPVLDLSALGTSRAQALGTEVATRWGQRPFDLERGPLFAVLLLRLEAATHWLATAVHHIVADGWSLGLLARELGELYRAGLAGTAAALPPLPVQYGDFARWQRAALRGPRLERELGFWRRELAGAPPVVELPLDRPRPALRSYRGSRVKRALAPTWSAALEAAARRLGVTPFMLWAAGLGTLLARLSGQRDLVLGTPVADRGQLELEGLIGFFTNTLALRLDLAGNPSAAELAGRVREKSLAAFSHREVPFERVVDELGLERDPSHAPLVQVLLAVQNLPAQSLELPGLVLEPLDLDQGRAPFDLTVVVQADGIGLEYASDLFDRATAERWLSWLLNAVAALGEGPEARLETLPLLTEPERAALLVEGNRTARELAEEPVFARIAAQAARKGGEVAIACGSETLTWAELEAQSTALARELVAHGVGLESRVGVCLERTPFLIVALLAVQKAGGAYVPLDPSYPADRLAWIVEDSRMGWVLAEAATREAVPASAAVVLLREQLGSAGVSPALPTVAGDNLAYVIYTSGSTGRPKGVAVRHRAVANFVASMERAPGVTDRDRVLALTTVAFDISVLEIFLPLAVGATVELVDRATAADGLALLARLTASPVTVMQATPATWRMLLEAGWAGDPRLKALSGGEALPRDVAEALLARTAELWNVYGPTETTVWSSVERLRPADLEAGRPVPVGPAIDNTEIHLVGPFRYGAEPVLPGAAGELVIGGEGLARGYFGKPALTAERFVPDAFSGRPGARLYRTGDLVRRAPGSRTYAFVGRVDHQVKVNGFRIELGEIEAVLASVPGVALAAAVVREDVPGVKRLAGYLQAEAGAATEEVLAAARLRLAERLPAYMVPAVLSALDALPLTPNGKVDRKAIVALAPAEAVAAAFVAPRTELEAALAGIWAEVLRLPQISVEDSFFALGGDSILVIQVVVRCRRLGLELTPLQVFQSRTIAALAAQLAAAGLNLPAAGAAVPPAEESAASEAFAEAGLSEADLESFLAGLEEEESLA